MPGNHSHVQSLDQQYQDEDVVVDLMAEQDPHDITGLLKLSLKTDELPLGKETPRTLLDIYTKGTEAGDDGAAIHSRFLGVLTELSPLRNHTLVALIRMFRKIVRNSAENKMVRPGASSSNRPAFLFPGVATAI